MRGRLLEWIFGYWRDVRSGDGVEMLNERYGARLFKRAILIAKIAD